ncbi:MAG: hypothetical protein MUC35_06745 [Candidatus Margulisbacteria bacterium]|jgi:hypothetical protein|nr:hypothetical protein [Candidatus Margulisiibacteriota bacterium]
MTVVARRALFPLLFIVALVSYCSGVPYPLFTLTVMLGVYAGISFIVVRSISARPDSSREKYFLLLCFNLVLGALAIYYTGGIESFVPQALMIVAVLTGLTMSLGQIMTIILVHSVSYALVLALEATGIVPHITIFPGFLDPAVYSRSRYFLVIPLANILSFAAITLNAYLAARLLEKREAQQRSLNLQLEQEARQLNDQTTEKAALQRELDRQVAALQAVKDRLEKMMVTREGELKDRINELEAINDRLTGNMAESERAIKLAVRRELELIEMENEANELLARLGRAPKY